MGAVGGIWLIVFHPWGEQAWVIPCAGPMEADFLVYHHKLHKRRSLIVRVKS